MSAVETLETLLVERRKRKMEIERASAVLANTSLRQSALYTTHFDSWNKLFPRAVEFDPEVKLQEVQGALKAYAEQIKLSEELLQKAHLVMEDLPGDSSIEDEINALTTAKRLCRVNPKPTLTRKL